MQGFKQFDEVGIATPGDRKNELQRTVARQLNRLQFRQIVGRQQADQPPG